MLKPLLRHKGVVAVEILADEHRCVPGILHRRADVLRRVEQDGFVLYDAVVVRMQPGKQVGTRGTAQWVLTDRLSGNGCRAR